tara:strand:- start:4108 stop:4692 length:585 start_codon:yes stop_codon:yes gene_type:complete
MADVASPYGAVPVSSLVSCAYNDKISHYKIASGYNTNIFYGDIVKWHDNNPNVTIQKDTGTTAMTPIGVFLGCSYTDPVSGEFRQSQYYPANTAASDIVAYVQSDPFVVMKMQCDGPVDQDDLGKNCAIAQVAGTTLIGTSRNVVDISTVATTNTLPVKIVDFVDGPGTAVNENFPDVLVMFNVGHQLLNPLGV